MTTKIRVYCRRCGRETEIDAYTPEETRERQREGRPTYRLHCPNCGSNDVEVHR